MSLFRSGHHPISLNVLAAASSRKASEASQALGFGILLTLPAWGC